MFFVLKFESAQMMCLRRAPEKYIAGAALDRAGLDNRLIDSGKVVSALYSPETFFLNVSGTHFF
jgi:hypothetical protein